LNWSFEMFLLFFTLLICMALLIWDNGDFYQNFWVTCFVWYKYCRSIANEHTLFKRTHSASMLRLPVLYN
jgi:hypothetical protein